MKSFCLALLLLLASFSFSQSVVIGTGVNAGGVNSQVGTSYTVVATDQGKLVTFNNGSAVTVSLPQATGQFGAGWYVETCDYGAGTVTITPQSGTINGGATLTEAQNVCDWIFSDGTNYSASVHAATSGLPAGCSADAPNGLACDHFKANGAGGAVVSLGGSSSGTITEKVQAAAGTWEWDWPITAGTTGQFLTSQGGAGTAMAWTTLATTEYMIGDRGGNNLTLSGTNKVHMSGFVLKTRTTFSQLSWFSPTSDAVNNYDVCIYSPDGATLLANVGATHPTGTLPETHNTLQGSQTLNPGAYIEAVTGNAITATFRQTSTMDTGYGFCPGVDSATASSGGVCPSSISVAACSYGDITGNANGPLVALGLH